MTSPCHCYLVLQPLPEENGVEMGQPGGQVKGPVPEKWKIRFNTMWQHYFTWRVLWMQSFALLDSCLVDIFLLWQFCNVIAYGSYLHIVDPVTMLHRQNLFLCIFLFCHHLIHSQCTKEIQGTQRFGEPSMRWISQYHQTRIEHKSDQKTWQYLESAHQMFSPSPHGLDSQ